MRSKAGDFARQLARNTSGRGSYCTLFLVWGAGQKTAAARDIAFALAGRLRMHPRDSELMK